MSKSVEEIKWQCRRGLWELDIILYEFAEKNYLKLAEDQKICFQELIANEDVDLLSWLVSREAGRNEKEQIIINIVLQAHHERMELQK